MSATEELRRLLDERGVKYDTRDSKDIKKTMESTYWDDSDGRRWGYTSDESGAIKDRQIFLIRGRMDFTPEQAINATLGVGRASGFQWHLMVDEAPEYGANDFVVMGMRGAMYLASEFSKYSAGGEGAYFYIPNRRDNFMDKKQVLAWAEIPPLEVDE